ncbi:hypothetical protein KR044_000861 [Drosophila immigrans]|nr:hypothetical protein KR044_000861 [Drosophila immigrans]
MDNDALETTTKSPTAAAAATVAVSSSAAAEPTAAASAAGEASTKNETATNNNNNKVTTATNGIKENNINFSTTTTTTITPAAAAVTTTATSPNVLTSGIVVTPSKSEANKTDKDSTPPRDAPPPTQITKGLNLTTTPLVRKEKRQASSRYNVSKNCELTALSPLNESK